MAEKPNVILNTTGVVKSISVMKSGVNKMGKNWQLFGFTIGVGDRDVKMSTFKNFSIPMGSTVEIGYTETPNPSNPQFNYLNIETIKVVQGQPQQPAWTPITGNPVQQAVNVPPAIITPQMPTLQFTAEELDKISKVYREKVNCADWSANHFIGTCIRYKSPDTVKQLIEAFDQKIMPLDSKLVPK